MVLTKEQLSESMMVSERREYLRENSASGNKCNGFARDIVTIMAVR